MDGYTVLYGALAFFGLFIYITWFGTSIKIEKEKNESPNIKINPVTIITAYMKGNASDHISFKY